MKRKQFVIASLAAVNVLLLTVLISFATPLPTANAQAGRSGGAGYVCASARAAGRTYEVLYMIDLATRKMHSFYPDRGKLLFSAVPRDLDKDFGN